MPKPETLEHKLTPLARRAVSHYGPGYDPSGAMQADDMYEQEWEEEVGLTDEEESDGGEDTEESYEDDDESGNVARA